VYMGHNIYFTVRVGHATGVRVPAESGSFSFRHRVQSGSFSALK